MRVYRVVVLSVLIGLALVCDGFCAKLEVGPGKRFQKIGPAVAAARNGDVISIAKGVYEESVIINKDVLLKGAGKKKCIIRGEGPLLRLVDIKKGGIQGVSLVVSGSEPACTLANVGPGFEIADCIFDGKGAGETALRIEGGAAPRFRKVLTRNFSGVGWELADNAGPEAVDCVWSHMDSYAVEVSGSALFVGKKCRIEKSKNGFKFMDQARADLESCVFSGLTGTGVTAVETRKVNLKKCKLVNMPVGLDIQDGGAVNSFQCTFQSCGVFAVKCSGTSGIGSKQDRFINNHVSVLYEGAPGSAGVEFSSPKFSNSVDGALIAMGEGGLRMTSPIFSGDKQPVNQRGAVEVHLVKPVFKGLEAGGISLTEKSRLILEDASFKKVPAGALTVTDEGRIVARRTEFSGGDKSPLLLAGSASAEFEGCKWSDLDDVAIRAGEEVSVRISGTRFSNVDIPLEAGMNSRAILKSVEMAGSKQGVVIRDHARLEAKGLKITKCADACVTLDSDGPLLLSDLVLGGKTMGLVCKGKSAPVIDGLEASVKQIGLLLTAGSRCEAKKLSFQKCARGVAVEKNAELRLDGGSVSGADHAVVITDSGAVEIRNLTVEKSKIGFTADADADVWMESASITAANAALTLTGNVKFTGRKVAATSKKKAIHIADQVTLDVIDLAANLTASKGACLLLEGAPAGLIDGLKTSGGGMGLRAGGKVDVQVKNVHIEKAREAGILLFETADLTIIGGVVEACRTGVEIREQARPRINSVTISACETGVRCLDDSLPRINNCKIADCKEGARVQDKSAPIIHRLEVSGGKPKGFGVGWFDEAAGKLLEPTIVDGPSDGIVVADNASPVIFGTEDSGRVGGRANGVSVTGAGRLILSNLTIDDNALYGVMVKGRGKSETKAAVYMTGCRARGHSKGAGVYVGEHGVGYILGAYRKEFHEPRLANRYTQNIIRANLVGVLLEKNAEAFIDGNMIESNSTGIEMRGKSRARIHRNDIRDGKFVEMDKRGEGVLIREKAAAMITEHNRIFKNRVAGIDLKSTGKEIRIQGNEIYENVNLRQGSALGKAHLGAVIAGGKSDVIIESNYIHDNKAPGVVIANELSTVMESNLIERNSTGGVEILKGKECRLENNTLVGMKREDFGILAKSSSNPKHGVLRNNILYRFARAFDGGTRMSRLPKKWEIRRNCVFNCDFENGQNLPDLLENYKVDPIFHNPNGKGEEDFTPESGSNVCKASARYDWGKDRYCGAFQCGEKKSSKGAVTIRILSPAQDGDIVPRSIEFRAVVKVCQGKKVASWGIFVNNNLEQQSRGISELESFQGCDEAKIEASIPSLPYGKSVIRLVVNGEAGERWAAERTVHTARCAEYRKRWVLLVGVSDYNEEGSIPDLRYAAADAIALEKLFNQRSPHAPNRDVEVILLTDAQATREGLRQALFGRIAPCARAEDEVIIFFAGHGLASRDRFFLALHDSNLDRLELTGYEMQELRDVIHYNVKSNRIVLFFDVCHSGAMNIEREPASILNTRLTQWSQTGSNLTIFSASSDKEASYEYPSCCPGGACDRGEEGPFSEAGHGVFTCALLHGLTGGALPMGETSVSLDLLADHLARSVPAATGQRQHPVTFGKLDEGFILTMPRDVGQGGGSGVKREDEQGEEGVK